MHPRKDFYFICIELGLVPTPNGKSHEKLPLFWIPSLSGGILKLHIKNHHNKTSNLAINRMFCWQKIAFKPQVMCDLLGQMWPCQKLKKAPIVNLSLGEVTAECKRLVIVCSIKPTGGASSLMSHCIPRGRITLHFWCSAQQWIFSSLTPKWRCKTLIKWWSWWWWWWW